MHTKLLGGCFRMRSPLKEQSPRTKEQSTNQRKQIPTGWRTLRLACGTSDNADGDAARTMLSWGGRALIRQFLSVDEF
jgi:hypothetical protein